MRIASLLLPKCIFPAMDAADGDAAIAQLVAALAEERPVDPALALRDIAARERKGPMVIPVGERRVAVPHAATRACKQLLIAVGVSPEGVPWRALRGERAHIVFVLLSPPEVHGLHLRALSRLARLCATEGFIEGVLAAASPQEVIERFRAAEEPLGEFAAAEGMPTFCVAGAGHGGMAMAAHLAIMGCTVNLWNRTDARIAPVRELGGIRLTGEVAGSARLNVVTSDPAEAVRDVDVVMVVVPATAHRNVVATLGPHLADGQILVLNPGRTGGALEAAKVLREINPTVRAHIAETQTLLYASRVTNPAQAHIFSIKNSVPLATLPAYEVADVLPVIRSALPQFVPGDNVLKTSLDNIGAVFHPTITILNAARIEDTHGDFEYYVEGVTPAVAEVLEAVDRERVAVAAALGIRALTAREWLYLAYDAVGKTLLEAMRANPGYAGIKAPGRLLHRYIMEDVPASLVPIAAIGEMFGVPTPAMRAVITLASAMHGVDYWTEGRTVQRLGIAGMSLKDIRFLVVGAGPAAQQDDPSQLLMPFEDGGRSGYADF